jgi:hypothetical protein
VPASHLHAHIYIPRYLVSKLPHILSYREWSIGEKKKKKKKKSPGLPLLQLLHLH